MRDLQENRIDLVYIAGTGHCGSTLLEMLLDAQPSVVSSGEVEMWPHKLKQNSRVRCGCGRLLADCPCWEKVRQRVDPFQQPVPQTHFFRNENGAGKVLRWPLLPEIVRGKASSQSISRAETYGRNSRAILRAFEDVVSKTKGEIEWIVDNSKNAYRLLWLIQSECFNVKVLHIVKSPRGFVYSTIKKMLREGESAVKVGATTLRKSLSWVMQNQLITRVVRAYLPTEHYRLVPYEKLAAQPEETMRHICQMIGTDFELESLGNFQGGHAIAGNWGARFSGEQIVLDETWKTALPKQHQWLTKLITGPFASAYGY